MLLPTLPRRSHSRSSRKQRRRQPVSRRLLLERFEDRTLLSGGLASGLIDYWAAEGNASDSAGGNNGMLQNGASFVPGILGQAFNLDGSAGYVSVTNPTGLPTGNAPRSMALWFRTPIDLTSSTESSLVQYGSTAAQGEMFGLITSLNSPGKLHFFGLSPDPGGLNYDLRGVTTLQPNTWYYGAVTYDGSSLDLYLNGNLEAAKAISLNTVLDPNGLTIGYRPDIGAHWNGQIDDVAIWNRALSSSELAQLYNAGAGQNFTFWTNAAGGDWDTASDWSTGVVPTAADNAVINIPGITVTHSANVTDSVHSLTSQDAIVLSDGTLSIGADSTINNTLTFSGGNLSTTGNLTVTGSLTMNNGGIRGTGTLAAYGGSTLTAGELNSATLALAGTTNFTGFTLRNGATLNNLGTLNIQGLGGVGSIGGSTFNNQGTINSNAGPGEVDVNGVFNNSGTVNLLSGRLDLGGGVDGNRTGPGGGGTSTGSYMAADNTLLVFWSGQTFTPTSSVSGYDIAFTAGHNIYGPALIQGSYSARYSTDVGSVASGGEAVFTGPILPTSDGSGIGALSIRTNSATFSTGATTPFEIPSLSTTDGGGLNGSDSFVIDGLITLTGGIAGTGSILAKGNVNFIGNGAAISGNKTVTSTGATTLNGSLLLDRGATFNSQGTFTVLSLNGIGNGVGVSTFNNQGTLISNAGPGEVDINPVFNNSGTVNVQAGTLGLGNTMSDTGVFNISAGTTLLANSFVQSSGATNLNGGSLNSSNPIAINGGALSGVGTVNGNVTNAGQVNPGGTGTAGALAINGNYTQTASGALNIEIDAQSAGNPFDQLAVSGTATLGGALNVSMLNGSSVPCGSAFPILSFGSRAGDFATKNGLTLTNGIAFTPTYSASSLTLSVPLVTTTTTIASSFNPSLLNQPLSFTATVSNTAPGGSAPTGTVQFQIDNTNFGSPITLTGGTASLSVASLAVGPHTVTASFNGDCCTVASSGSLTQNVFYNFSGFLAPLSNNLAFNQNRTIPIKWQLSDFNGSLITNLSAVTSLQVAPVLSGGGLGTPFNPTPAGGSGLRNDGTQYIFNWDTKNVAVGSYKILLTLADGTVQTKTLQIVTKGGYNGLLIDGTNGTAVTGGLLGGDIALYVDNASGLLTSDERARIDDAVAAVDAVIGAYGVTITEVADSGSANVVLDMGSSSAAGGYADGVLGCTTDAGEITLISGWNWYAGSAASQIGAGQYDFETVVVHELGHALGLGHSTDSTSVMYATLNTGTVDRSLKTADLNVPDSDTGGACGLHAAVSPVAMTQNTSLEANLSSGSFASALPTREPARSLLFTVLGADLSQSSGAGPLTNGFANFAARDAVFSAVLTDVPRNQDFALPGGRNSGPIFATQPVRPEDDPLFDVPLLPYPADGHDEEIQLDTFSDHAADSVGEFMAADPTLLDN